MNNNLIRKYNWLIQTLNVHGQLTYQQISDLWAADRTMGKGEPLDWRKFQRWRVEIKNIFGLEIGVTKRQPYMYFFVFPDDQRKSGAREMFLDALAMQQFVLNAQSRAGVVVFGEYKPRYRYLDLLLRGIREYKIVKVFYSIGKKRKKLYEVKPLQLRMEGEKWLLSGNNKKNNEEVLLNVDQIAEVVLTDEVFERLLFF